MGIVRLIRLIPLRTDIVSAPDVYVMHLTKYSERPQNGDGEELFE